jgi:glycosyltransferase involved in cell wall biosynthesis
MSSRYEGFPMVILEAFACGLPVVSYNCPRGPGEMITTGHDGLVVENSNIDALAQGLLQLINDPELRRTMSKNALATAERHSIESVGKQWDQLFEQLRANRSKRPRRPMMMMAKRGLLRFDPRRRRGSGKKK